MYAKSEWWHAGAMRTGIGRSRLGEATGGTFALAGALALLAVSACSSDVSDPSGPGGSSGGSGGAGQGGVGGDPAGGAGGDGGLPPTECELLQQELQAALDAVQSSETIPGVGAEVRAGECVFSGGSGFADLASMTPVAPGDVFRVGSITKTFVAATLVQLQSEGLLSLDDTIETHLPGLLPDGGAITVRQVLSHTSGLFNYTDHPDFFDDALAQPTHVWPPAELVAYATSEPLDFAPGTSWSYSNTGYVVAGMVIEAVTGNGAAEEIRSRIIEPAGLRQTFLAGDEPDPPELIHGYTESGGYLDVTHLLDPSAAWTAGALVSSTADLSAFYAALLSGNLLSDNELAEMTTWVDAGQGEYGLGLLHQRAPFGEIIGHGGAIWGFQSIAVVTADGEQAYTILINSGTDAINPVLAALADVVAAN
jgi:D-alanyl-D-alanine carboxypeptidase